MSDSVGAAAPAPVVRTSSAAAVASTIGLLGLAGWLVALAADPAKAMHAWLTAWSYGLSLALGALCLVMIAHLTRARWFVVVRRVAEATAMSLPGLALGVVPLVLGGSLLYPWARPVEELSPAMRERVGEVSPWLDPEFVVVRALLYLAVWSGLALLLWRASIAADARAGRGSAAATSHAAATRHAGDEGGARGVERTPGALKVSAVGLILFGLTVTFAALDWLMSLRPEWYSTVFGLYWFAGAMVGALSALVVLTGALRSADALGDGVARSHYHALGRLLLAFVVFWAYVAYSQGFLVWIGNVPADIDWYLARRGEGWTVALVVLVVAHFLLPFLVLLNYAIKRRPDALTGVAAWLLVAHWLDTYWLVGPRSAGAGAIPGWEHLAASAAVLGLGFAFGAAMLDGKLAAPGGDPSYATSLRYESR